MGAVSSEYFSKVVGIATCFVSSCMLGARDTQKSRRGLACTRVLKEPINTEICDISSSDGG